METVKRTMSFEDLINSEKPVFIDFYATWCGPCQAMAPVIDNLKHEVGDKAIIVKIDVDRNPQISEQLQVMSIPTLMIFQGGDLKWRAMGMQPIQTMKAEIEKLL